MLSLLLNFYHCCITYKCMNTSLFFNNYDKLHLLYAGGSHVSTLECLYDCLLDNMFLFCWNNLIILFYLIGFSEKEKHVCEFKIFNSIWRQNNVLHEQTWNAKKTIRRQTWNTKNVIIAKQNDIITSQARYRIKILCRSKSQYSELVLRQRTCAYMWIPLRSLDH